MKKWQEWGTGRERSSGCWGPRLFLSDSGAPAAFPLCSAVLWQRSRLLMEQRCSGALLQLQWKVRVWLPPQLHAKSSFSQRSGLGWQLYLWAKTDQPVQHIYKETSLLATHQVRKNKIICGLASKINSQFCSVLRYEYFINHYLRNSKNSPTERVGENGKGKILIN